MAEIQLETERRFTFRPITIYYRASRQTPSRFNIAIHDLRFTIHGGSMINQERIKNLLLELVQIDSHSRKERDVA